MNDNKSSGGIGFASLLLLAFIILKLTHYIDWSWWWVLSPFWIPIALICFILLVYLLAAGSRSVRQQNKKAPWVKSKWQERLEQIQADVRKQKSGA